MADPTRVEDRARRAHCTAEGIGQRLDECEVFGALDAAAAGNGAVCLAAVKKVTSSARRDLLAEDCAIRLAKAGDSTAASEVANQIGAAGRRSEVNKEIATIR